MKTRNIRGSVLLEWLVAMLLLSIASALFLSGHHWAYSFDEFQERKQKQLYERLLVYNILLRAAEHIDSHRLPLLPKLYPSNVVRFSNSSIVEALYRSSMRTPHPEADALSSLRLLTQRTLRVVECNRHQDLLRLRGCLLVSDNASFALIRNAVLLGPDSTRVFSARITGNGRCRNVLIRKTRSLYDDYSPQPLSCSTAFIIPVDLLEVLYQDSSLTLRMARFRGDSIFENQPIEQLDSLLRLESQETNGFYTLKFRLEDYDATPKRIIAQGSFTHSLSRSSPYDWILNL